LPTRPARHSADSLAFLLTKELVPGDRAWVRLPPPMLIFFKSKKADAAAHQETIMFKTLSIKYKPRAAIVPDICKTFALVQESTAASTEQSSGVGQINSVVGQLSQTTQQNAARPNSCNTPCSSSSSTTRDRPSVLLSTDREDVVMILSTWPKCCRWKKSASLGRWRMCQMKSSGVPSTPTNDKLVDALLANAEQVFDASHRLCPMRFFSAQL